MTATPLRRWISFDDEEGNRWLFDATFLLSRWHCVYGRGCRGIVSDAAQGAIGGCCSFGAHLVDDEDRSIVVDAAARLTPEVWENHAMVAVENDLFSVDDDGDFVTALGPHGCIFQNGPEWPTGAGCALHYEAVQQGENPLHWKPQVCWQLPLRLDELTDVNEHVTYLLRPWTALDWGPEGANFTWWCTSDIAAYTDDDPVYVHMGPEIEELIGTDVALRLFGELERLHMQSPQQSQYDVPVDLSPRAKAPAKRS